MKKQLLFTLSLLVFSKCLPSLQGLQHKDFLEKLQNVSDFKTKNELFLELTINATQCKSPNSVLKIAIEHISIDGTYLEMGVFKGGTINFIANQRPNNIIHGFDSFEGLPEAWEREDTNYFQKGTFALKGLPAVAFNVKLYKGWFSETLPIFKKNILKNQPIAFMHIDCDIYSSTKTIFDLLGDNIIPGTILSFDELYNYPGFENHELKAFFEFLDTRNLSAEFLAYNSNHEQVAIKIIEN